jgi:hypothetical protein
VEGGGEESEEEDEKDDDEDKEYILEDFVGWGEKAFGTTTEECFEEALFLGESERIEFGALATNNKYE